ncbi:MAG: hypothetical protein ACJ8AW_03030 [Rhodopila sp.]
MATQARQYGRLEVVLAFVFGCLALASVLWLAFRSDSINDQQFETLRVVLALAGGGVGAVVQAVSTSTSRPAPHLPCPPAALWLCL